MASFGVSCRNGPPPAIDPTLAVLVPAGATILAGVNLERVRASPIFRQIPAAARALLDSWGSARSVLLASDGRNYLVLTPGAAPSGSPDWVRSAESPGTAVTNGLVARAEPAAAQADIWIAAAGSANLPLKGNGENLSVLLHGAEYALLTFRLTDTVAIDLNGVCRGPEPARQLEERVRAMLTLGAAGTARQPAVYGLLRRIRVTRDDKTVHVSLAAQVDELETVFRLLGIGS